MAARNRPDGIGHDHDGEPDCKGDAENSRAAPESPERDQGSAKHGRDQGESADELGNKLVRTGHSCLPTPLKRTIESIPNWTLPQNVAGSGSALPAGCRPWHNVRARFRGQGRFKSR